MITEQPGADACDREPIHVPGSIQPHGLLFILEPGDLKVRAAAGDVAGRLGLAEWIGRPFARVVGRGTADLLGRFAAAEDATEFVARWRAKGGEAFDLVAHRASGALVVEFEPGAETAPAALGVMAELERANGSFERASNLAELCARAAAAFRELTGFDRVMVYRFVDGDAGTVVAEDRSPDLSTFLHHHFPASDIPRQARALYIRNVTRVIPDVGYTPAPIEPALPGAALDMSDCLLRSVSPVHVQYLKNMGVQASASVSIVIDGALWGLIACHHRSPKMIPYEARAGCRSLAGGLARQIKGREEAETYRERIRLRAFEDDLVAALGRSTELATGLDDHADDLLSMLRADGVAVVCGRNVSTTGSCPPAHEIEALSRWLAQRYPSETCSTDRLGLAVPAATTYAPAASGLTAITFSTEEPFALLWFRAETIEVVKWAGDPHKSVTLAPGETLTPRSSFAAWSEEVRGRSRRWTLAEVESAGRLRRALLELRQTRRLREMNARLTAALAEKELLIGRNEVLLREVNHRVQNSLTLVSSFLSLQKRGSDDAVLRAALDEAQRRVVAVGLVHRRLYRGDQVETIELDRYLGEMRDEMILSMGPEWETYLTLDASPTIVPTDKAVSLGLIVTELIINANKYAYGGERGPIAIALREDRSDLRLSVSDQGRGAKKPAGGFGTRMMESLVQQLRGRLDYLDNRPGLRVILTAPVA